MACCRCEQCTTCFLRSCSPTTSSWHPGIQGADHLFAPCHLWPPSCRLLCAQAIHSAARDDWRNKICSNTGAAHQFKKQRFSASSRVSKLKAQLREDEELNATLANVRRMTLAEAPFTALVRDEEVKLNLAPNLAARISKHATAACEHMQASISGADHATGSA